LNGEIIEGNGPVISENNRAFKYGDALFETIRYAHKHLCFLDDHLERLNNGAVTLGLAIPAGLEREALISEVELLCAKNEVSNNARIRITLFRGEGGLYAPENDQSEYLIEVKELSTEEYTLNKEGLKIDLFEKHRKPTNELATLKSTNCLIYILAGLEKNKRSLDDCIILNDLGSIVETISSNIFIVFNGVIYTPAINQGVIPGVMRKNIMQIAKEHKIEVQECPLSPEAILKADEVLLTNAISGVQWVGAYRRKRFFSKMSKFLVEELNKKVASLALDLQESQPE